MVLELKSFHFSHPTAADIGEWNHLVSPSWKLLHTFPLFVRSISSPWVSEDYSADSELGSYYIGFEEEESSSELSPFLSDWKICAISPALTLSLKHANLWFGQVVFTLNFILSGGFSFSNCLAQVHCRNSLDADCPFLLLALKRLRGTKLLAGSCAIIYFTQQSVLHNKIYNIKDSQSVLFKKESVNPLHA